VGAPRWQALAAKGACTQRLLWASTGTKDPRYSDTMYIDGLIGEDTVNTVPPATLKAFMDHGTPAPALAADLDEAHAAIAEFAALGFDLGRVCAGLLADGVKSFETSMTTLMEAISARRAAILEQAAGRQRLVFPAALAKLAEAEAARLGAAEAPRRLWASDPTLFTADPAHEKSIRSRLGWLRAPAALFSSPTGRDGADRVADLEAFAAEVRDEGFTDAVLLGMGGSSLAPEVLSLTYGHQGRGLELHVLDNTDPAAVARVDKRVEGKRTLYIVASKSGGTIEIQSFERFFWQKELSACGGDVARAGARFVAITDPATRLGQLAEEKKYRRVFTNAADIGGRYSALSYFGLVPAALLGADVRGLVQTALDMAHASAAVVAPAENPGLVLGAALGAAAKEGRDKLTLISSPEVESLGSWIEQLIAESTGKDGKGIVPVDGEPLGPPDVYGSDRLFVYIRFGEGRADQKAAVAALERAGQPVVHITVENKEALGREFYRWEVATAIAGASLGVNPFDEPNVTEAKLATSAILAVHAANGRVPEPEGVCDPGDAERIRRHLSAATPGDYLAFCAYFMPTEARAAALARLRVACRDRSRNATTLGYGPRFLHSTGQLHKGGANNGVFLQITADALADLPIPGESYSFATLRSAQALGDLQVLVRRGRRVLRVHLGSDIDGGLATLVAAVEGAGAAAARKTA
jgi:transaldolase/glucose-6-phosphate isomerase